MTDKWNKGLMTTEQKTSLLDAAEAIANDSAVSAGWGGIYTALRTELDRHRRRLDSPEDPTVLEPRGRVLVPVALEEVYQMWANLDWPNPAHLIREANRLKIEAGYAKIRIDSTLKTNQRLSKEVRDLKACLEAMGQANHSLGQESRDLRLEIIELKDGTAELRASLDLQEKDVVSLRADLLGSSQSAARQSVIIQEQNEELDQLKTTVQELEHRNRWHGADGAREEIDSLRTEVAETLAEVKKLQGVVRERDRANASMAVLVQAARRVICNPWLTPANNTVVALSQLLDNLPAAVEEQLTELTELREGNWEEDDDEKKMLRNQHFADEAELTMLWEKLHHISAAMVNGDWQHIGEILNTISFPPEGDRPTKGASVG